MKKRTEILAFLLLLTLGLTPRILMIVSFPTIPVSDFHNLVAFGLHLRDDGVISNNHPEFWENFSVGLPLVLYCLFKVFPHADPDAVARFATAFVSGLFPLLPFLIWRGVLSIRVRVLAGAALALWPGQVVFSGIVAQDNWTIFPTIALGALAVRALADGERAWPVTAGLLFTAAVAMRQDMLIVLPLLLAAVRVDLLRIRPRQALAGCLAAVLGLVGLASYRAVASGRFSLSTEHGGVTILGAYIPGSSSHGWVAPYAFLASVRPDLLRDRKALLTKTLGVTVQEALRRPAFHALRIVSMTGFYAIHGESLDPVYGRLEAPEVLPGAIHERGIALAARLKLPLRIEMAFIQALFLAAVIVGFRQWNWSILVLSSAVLLKYGLHALVVFYGRFFFPATGLEILTIAVAVEEVLRMPPPGRRSLLVGALVPAAAFVVGLYFLTPPLMAYVQSRDIDPGQHTYHFYLQPPDHKADLDCTVHQGLLAGYTPPIDAMLRTLQPHDPAPGDKATAECVLAGSGEPRQLMLRVFDPFAPGGLGGRMVQRVELDGEEVFYHDVGLEPGGGWANIPLGLVGAGTNRRVVIEVEAIHPEPGAEWAYVSRTLFQLARSSSVVHLAMGRPTAQSSNLGSDGASGAADDGSTDGDFYHGSVTATNRDPGAWWQVDLGASKAIGSVVIWNRTDCCSARLSDYWVFLSDTPFSPGDTPATLEHRGGTWSSHQTTAPHPSTTIATDGAKGRYVRVQLNGTDYLSLAEVQVFGQ